MRRAILAALCSFTLCGAAEARVRLDLRYGSYVVRGTTAEAIWRDIGLKGPHQVERGLYAQAEARIEIGWKVVFQQRGGTCRATRAEVDVEVRILLPRWADERRANGALRAAWRRYASKVRAHEDRHKDIALASAKKIDALLGGARPIAGRSAGRPAPSRP